MFELQSVLCFLPEQGSLFLRNPFDLPAVEIEYDIIILENVRVKFPIKGLKVYTPFSLQI